MSHDHDGVARIVERGEGGDPRVVGLFAVVDCLGGAGLGGDLDVLHAHAAGGASGLVDRFPHSGADLGKIALLDTGLEEVDFELRNIGKHHGAVFGGDLADDARLVVFAAVGHCGDHCGDLEWSGEHVSLADGQHCCEGRCQDCPRAGGTPSAGAGEDAGVLVGQFDPGFLPKAEKGAAFDHRGGADEVGEAVEVWVAGLLERAFKGQHAMPSPVFVPDPAADWVAAIHDEAVAAEVAVCHALDGSGNGGWDLHGRAWLEGGDGAVGERGELFVRVVGYEFFLGDGGDEGIRIVIRHGGHGEDLAGVDIHYDSGCPPGEAKSVL